MSINPYNPSAPSAPPADLDAIQGPPPAYTGLYEDPPPAYEEAMEMPPIYAEVPHTKGLYESGLEAISSACTALLALLSDLALAVSSMANRAVEILLPPAPSSGRD